MATVRSRLAHSVKLATRHTKSRSFSSTSQYGSDTASTTISIASLLDRGPADPNNVCVNGFVRSVRSQKRRSFVDLGDGSTLEPLQALLSPEQAQSLSTGMAVRLKGAWKESRFPESQTHELHVTAIDTLGFSDAATNPIQKKYQTKEFLRTIPHLRSRIPFNSTLLRLRSDCISEITRFLAAEGFTQTHTPIITSSDCEGAGEVFHLESSHKGPISEHDDGTFFRSPKYLTVSSQLHLEALAQSIGNVWTLSPTFRAEKSDTKRHLSEFYMLELEMSFVEDMSVVMNVVEKLVQSITLPLLTSRVGKELLATRTRDGEETGESSEWLRDRWLAMKGPWPRITYTEAIQILQTSGINFTNTPQWGLGFSIEHEQHVASVFKKPVFVTQYPRDIKPFYMLPSRESTDMGETVDCFDLLLPEAGELVGGSMREHRLDPLIASMRSSGMIPHGPPEFISDEQLGSLKWYVDLRRWGSVPHGGFGLGFDRLLGYLAGVQNIRDVNTFPRWVGRCEC
ncbi:hypothetical protein HYALB_00003374 [Hymenoscyphus albidus]|uniref:asparagine--tRNA ligase n=1 Tax=Hymenoscyphus albidus TaxID=595503 RepID=A0A9N9LMV0_9HELO|nr:hypothetical protein HYALB_00003374 [Hymenoscyphus albidus]